MTVAEPWPTAADGTALRRSTTANGVRAALAAVSAKWGGGDHITYVFAPPGDARSSWI
ncbi:hypothetical protein [Nonomuraea bangladeshensis]|uniref:hypothetical protein n=1 Tax=Nonomuraea bangladeshensis TaxID=404385 RepID=UPI003C2D9D8C